MADTKGNLRRFSDMNNVDIADGDPDPRGWDVVTPDGREVGEVEDLVVDTDLMKVRCLEVSLDRDTFGIDEDRHVLLPLETAQLDRDDDKVIVNSARDAIRTLPAFSGEAVESEYYRGFGDYGRTRATNASRERATGYDDATGKLTRAGEELRISTRPVSAGTDTVTETQEVDADVRKEPFDVQKPGRPATADRGRKEGR